MSGVRGKCYFQCKILKGLCALKNYSVSPRILAGISYSLSRGVIVLVASKMNETTVKGTLKCDIYECSLLLCFAFFLLLEPSGRISRRQ